jgi:hypothetical protein
MITTNGAKPPIKPIHQIVKPGDTNAKSSGAQRQICWQLKAGEAG